MLCAMKEAADVEIQRLQDKLSKFVDEVCSSGPGKAVQQAVNLRSGMLPNNQKRPVVFDRDDSD